jgi:diacylglycerol kinase (ATP)
MTKGDRQQWRRLVNATRYSLRGLRSAWRGETAFRQEAIAVGLLLVVSLLLDVTPTQRALLILVSLAIPIVELLNSAIEAAVDRIGPERHPLAAQAKDMGSAAVLISLIAAGAVWGLVLWEIFF